MTHNIRGASSSSSRRSLRYSTRNNVDPHLLSYWLAHSILSRCGEYHLLVLRQEENQSRGSQSEVPVFFDQRALSCSSRKRIWLNSDVVSKEISFPLSNTSANAETISWCNSIISRGEAPCTTHGVHFHEVSNQLVNVLCHSKHESVDNAAGKRQKEGAHHHTCLWTMYSFVDGDHALFAKS